MAYKNSLRKRLGRDNIVGQQAYVKTSALQRAREIFLVLSFSMAGGGPLALWCRL